MESWDHSRAAVEPTLAAARAESMPFTAMPRVRTWNGASLVSEAYLDSALWNGKSENENHSLAQEVGRLTKRCQNEMEGMQKIHIHIKAMGSLGGGKQAIQ